jgi:hypothetical protein
VFKRQAEDGTWLSDIRLSAPDWKPGDRLRAAATRSRSSRCGTGGFDQAGATGPPNQQVTVANSSADPVPVQQQGTATVNVGNTPLPVTGTVRIDPAGNTVQLGGTATVHTQAADNPAFTPIHLATVVTLRDGQFGDSEVLYQVPAGKELVIQQVSFSGRLPTGENITEMAIESSDGSTWFPVLSDEPDGAQDAITGGGPATIYVGAGSGVVAGVSRFSASDIGIVYMFANGYLVNLP